MMKVQAINCQPLRPAQSNLSFKSGYAGYMDDAQFDENIHALMRERDEWSHIAQNKDSKMLSALGTFAVSGIAGALSFCTFKTVAPKGAQTLKSMYGKVADLKPVKAAVKGVKTGVAWVGNKVANLYGKINPESKAGKAKRFVETKLSAAKEKVSPLLQKGKEKVGEFAKKHNINKQWFKTAANNVGATAVAVPAAITAADADLNGGEG